MFWLISKYLNENPYWEARVGSKLFFTGQNTCLYSMFFYKNWKNHHDDLYPTLGSNKNYLEKTRMITGLFFVHNSM